VGLGDLQVRAGVGKEEWQVTGTFTLPTSTLDSPLALQSPHYRASATYTETWSHLKLVGQVTGHYKSQFGVSGSAGIDLFQKVQVETRGEYSDVRLLESSLGYRHRFGDWTLQPAFAYGWLQGPGAPQWRGLVNFSYSPVTSVKSAEVLPVPDTTPITETVSAPEALANAEVVLPAVTPETSVESTPTEPASPTPPTPPPPAPPEGYQGMGQLAGVLLAHPEILLVHLEVHTSCEGSKSQQLIRSQKAADQIKLFLLAQGILETRVTMIARGATQPVAPCPEKSEEDRKKNRRVDARVIEVRE
jgi:hypothetical protein